MTPPSSQAGSGVHISVDGMAAAVSALQQAFEVAEPLVDQVLLTLEPAQQDFGERWVRDSAAALAPLWPAVMEALAGLEPLDALRQAWALALSSAAGRPWWPGLLHRAALAQPDGNLQAESSRLATVTRTRWQHARTLSAGWHRERQPHLTVTGGLPAESPGVADAMAALAWMLLLDDPASVQVPDLSGATWLKGSTRLRYRLAWHLRTATPLPKLLALTVAQPGVTDYQRKVEFARALTMAAAAQPPRKLRPLRDTELALLGPREQDLVLAMPQTWPALLTSGVRSVPSLVDHVTVLRQRVREVRDWMDSLLQVLRSLALSRVDTLLPDWRDDTAAQALLPWLKAQDWGLLGGAVLGQGADASGWQPMRPESLSRLQAWAPRTLPPYWALSASEVVCALCEGRLKMYPQEAELQRMRRDWTSSDQRALVLAGFGRLLGAEASVWRELSLDELVLALAGMGRAGQSILAVRLRRLRDARPWLALMGRQRRDGTRRGRWSPKAWDEDKARALRELADEALQDCTTRRWDDEWGLWVARSVGTSSWRRVASVAQAGVPLLHAVVASWQRKRTPRDPAGQREDVARWLHTACDPVIAPTLPLIQTWLELDPPALPVLLRLGPAALLLQLASSRATRGALLQRMLDDAQAAVAGGERAELHTVWLAVWRQLMRRAQSLDDLARLVLRQPRDSHPAPWRESWLRLVHAHTPPESAAVLVLAARRHGLRLRQVIEHLNARLGADKTAQSLLRARQQLCAPEAAPADAPADPPAHGPAARAARAPREAAMLELVQALGADVASSLMQVFAMSSRTAAPGCKLDAAYSRHLRPKKRGGNRVISAPHMALKRVQRAVLDRLLSPLGAHSASYGFVRGRSILDNARVHVGQQVVVNADVADCFPSVRWPLVLAALRRDLGGRLSSVAISMLCDVCTAEGGLPIGAPTSPALLNRVLLRTDEILSEAAAAKGLRYTRYADDLTFSGDSGAVGLLGLARHTLQRIGLELDARKTNIFRRGRRQMVTGLAVNDQASVPRRLRRRLRAAVHRVERGDKPHWHGSEQPLPALKGRLAFVKMVHPQEGAQLMARLRRTGRMDDPDDPDSPHAPHATEAPAPAVDWDNSADLDAPSDPSHPAAPRRRGSKSRLGSKSRRGPKDGLP